MDNNFNKIFGGKNFSDIFGNFNTQSFELIIDDSEISLFRKFVTEYKKYLQKNSSANLSIVINEEGDIIFKIERFTALEMFYLGIYMAQNGYKYEFVEFTNKNDEIPEGPQKR